MLPKLVKRTRRVIIIAEKMSVLIVAVLAHYAADDPSYIAALKAPTLLTAALNAPTLPTAALAALKAPDLA